MKNGQNKTKAAKPRALSSPEQVPAPEQDRSKRRVTLPADPAAQRTAIKDVFVNVVGASVLSAQMRPFVSEDADGTASKSAELFVEAIRESVRPRDATEEMLVVQMAWTHARLARLSAIAHNQEQRGNVQVVHDACDRAANTFRRQMLTLAEYRRPAQPNNFMAIRQANLAQQQVVQNVESPNSRNSVASNEQGSAPAALLPVTEGLELPAGDGAAKQAVAAEHRPQDGYGQGPVEAERDEARRA